MATLRRAWAFAYAHAVACERRSLPELANTSLCASRVSIYLPSLEMPILSARWGVTRLPHPPPPSPPNIAQDERPQQQIQDRRLAPFTGGHRCISCIDQFNWDEFWLPPLVRKVDQMLKKFRVGFRDASWILDPDASELESSD